MSEVDERIKAAVKPFVDQVFETVETTITQATGPLVARIEELERQVAELYGEQRTRGEVVNNQQPDSADRLLRAYARLSALRANLPEKWIAGEYGHEYNNLVRAAARELGIDLTEFELDPSGFWIDEHRSTRPEMVDVTLFLEHFDGLLGYLRARMPAEAVSRIGFVSAQVSVVQRQ